MQLTMGQTTIKNNGRNDYDPQHDRTYDEYPEQTNQKMHQRPLQNEVSRDSIRFSSNETHDRRGYNTGAASR